MRSLPEFLRLWAGAVLFTTTIMVILAGGQVLAWVLEVGQ